MIASPRVVPIEQHSLLSDQRTAAIVAPDARVTWLCVPRIDSDPIFAELLGGPAAGYFAIVPAEPAGSPRQRYLDRSMVLETSWDGVTVTDYLDCSDGRPAEPAQHTSLVRVLSGTGRAVIEFAPSLNWFAGALLEQRGDDLVVSAGAGLGDDENDRRRQGPRVATLGGDQARRLWLRHGIRLRAPGVVWEVVSHGRNERARAEVDLSTGPVVLEMLCGGTTGHGPLPEPDRRSATAEHWQAWLGGLVLPPLHTDLAARSALVLKALCHAPTGAILAAPTTSLPQCIGGSRNWDYRYCWVRDGTMAAATLVRLGSTGEAMDLLDWLMRLMDDGDVSPDRLAPMYTVDGDTLPPEKPVEELAGYAGSLPVRIGNAAEQQVQTDTFGPVMELVHRLGVAGAPLSERHWYLVEQLMGAVERCWQEPDHGIWEFRTAPRHHVHSKVMCWLAAGRAASLARTVFDRPMPAWEQLRDAIAAEVLDKGWNPEVGSFTAAYGSTDIDSSVLMVGLSGLVEPDDPRLGATVDTIEDRLRDGAGVHRYRGEDGLPGTAGAFNLMTSWLIDAKILVGDLDGARSLLDDHARLAGPTGLMSEEHDPATGQALGNFPQAFSHLGLIENAFNLAEATTPARGTSPRRSATSG